MAKGVSYKDVGQRVRNLREANEYTRDAFAEKIDISNKFLYEIEMGKKGFSAETLYKISKALSVSCDYILTGNESNKVPGRVVDILEGFSPKQMVCVQELLKLVWEISAEQRDEE
ncbi:MAG: helix-turn-helix transcriptional regulator [Firmicutes bacterium]|nr:helix-turn-helix transcriptional regulator [Bacillota bacterium]